LIKQRHGTEVAASKTTASAAPCTTVARRSVTHVFIEFFAEPFATQLTTEVKGGGDDE
jgi:hypothetical protein